MMRTGWWSGVLLAAVVLSPRAAEACGGFFCSNVPVDQSGEHLLFGIEDDGTVVAQIQIQYEGAAEDFAWVLPLPAAPIGDPAVGSDQVFRTLRQLTDPQLRVQWNDPDGCYWGGGGWDMAGEDGAAGAPGAGVDGDADGVQVLSQGPVGPYDYVTLTADDAQVLLDWLDEHDYLIPDSAAPAIQSYVNAGYVFLALQLQKDRSVGDLQPIVVRFPESGPCVPLRLTAIAATPDMPVYAWVLAEGRAVSTNFLDVEPNWAAIDWLQGPTNYADVVRRAVDEAAGHALVTEYAGDEQILERAFWFEGKYDVDALRGITDPVAFVDELMAQPFQGSTELLNLLRRFIPKPDSLADIDDQSFYNCLGCYADELAGQPFDPEGFADALLAVIVQPLIDAQELADRHPYLTRLYTAISPEEMNDDPVFRFNLDLGDVSNDHVAEASPVCDQVDDLNQPVIRLTLPDGRVMIVEPSDPGYPGSTAVAEDMPAARRATQEDETGPGDILFDNDDAIDDAIARTFGPSDLEPPDGDPTSRSPVTPHTARGGCAMTGGVSRDSALALAIAGLALALLRRRRTT